MHESWRTSMRTKPQNSYEALAPENFDDVFGGPPRSVLSRQFSVEGDFARSRSSLLFEDVFRKQDRTLPELRIPERKVGGGRRSEEEFYGDVFGDSWRSTSRSKSSLNSNTKSKSNSSSVLSSEELSPFRPAVGDGDGDGYLFRPVNVSSKWYKTKKMHEVQPMANSPCNSSSFESDYIHKFKGFSQKNSSPEITTFGPNSYACVKESVENLQVNSPASIVSSLNQDQGDETGTILEEDDEIMGAYVIEINPSKSQERIRESVGVDDAIAWAKEKCESCNLEKEWNKRGDEEHGCPGVEEGIDNVPEGQINESVASSSMELELLDEDIKLWSEGKELDIRLLLSTLHHILWPSSGWIMIPLTNLKDNSNVKKAYQKARLCLHPDKLQQRGATISQKYVADKAFPILQDAWASFISQDVLYSIK